MGSPFYLLKPPFSYWQCLSPFYPGAVLCFTLPGQISLVPCPFSLVLYLLSFLLFPALFLFGANILCAETLILGLLS